MTFYCNMAVYQQLGLYFICERESKIIRMSLICLFLWIYAINFLNRRVKNKSEERLVGYGKYRGITSGKRGDTSKNEMERAVNVFIPLKLV